MIKTVSDSQEQIITNILNLHTGPIDADVTYSKGVFYRNLEQPKYKFDLFPQTEDTVKANANDLPSEDSTFNCVMFDPPFIAGHTKDHPTGIIGERFHGFRYVSDLWTWYDSVLEEMVRVIKPKGWLIVKCQDTVSSGKQWWSHVHLVNKAEELGFYTKDLFVLTAKHRIIGHNHKNQKHARKFHSYFLVFQLKNL